MSGTSISINSKTYENIERIFIDNSIFTYSGKLPDGYKFVNGIHSHDGAYIDTDCTFQAGDIVKLTFIEDSTASYGCLFGVRYATGVTDELARQIMVNKAMWVGTTDKFSLIFIGQGVNRDYMGQYNPSYLPDVENELVLNIGNSAYLNGEELETPYDYTFVSAGISEYAPFLFANNNVGDPAGTNANFGSGCILGYSIERSGALIVDMVPVVSSDGVYGMYDLARSRFFTSPNGKLFS